MFDPEFYKDFFKVSDFKKTEDITFGNKYILYKKDNDEFHNPYGPAVECDDGYKAWFINGKPHREDGPAIEWEDGTKEWALFGEYLEKEKFNSWVKRIQ